MSVKRIYVEKRPEYAVEAKQLLREIRHILLIKSVTGLRLINRYDTEGIDDELYAAVRDYARETKTSLGAAFKQLARRALGLPTAEEKARIDAANALFGCLSEEDVRPIREALKLQSQIEPEMWK